MLFLYTASTQEQGRGFHCVLFIWREWGAERGFFASWKTGTALEANENEHS